MVSFHFRKEWYKNPISDKYRNVVIKVPLNESMKEKKEEKVVSLKNDNLPIMWGL